MRSPSKQTLRFTRVHLANWRNFSRVDVGLQKRAFLVGPNASGKSNFLDVFRFLHDIVSVGGGFQAAAGSPGSGRGGVSAIRCLAARRFPHVVVEVNVGTDDSPCLWEYRLAFSQGRNGHSAEIIEERLKRSGADLLKRPNKEDREDSELLSQTHLEQVNVNKEFRELNAFFASVQYLHLVPQLVREPERSARTIRNDPYGGDFLERIAGLNGKTRKGRLSQILKTLKAAVPQLSNLELWRDARGTPHLRAKYEHWRPQGKWQSEKDLSDGTLRLIGLLWVLLDTAGPLLLEEPELSLHHEIVRRIPQMFARMQSRSGRQVIVSTHSFELFLDEGIGLDEVLLLLPGEQGTTVRLAADIEEVKRLLESGISLAEAVVPRTGPDNIQQLAFPWD